MSVAEVKSMKDRILSWFSTGETGVSSATMARVAADVHPFDDGWPETHPTDPVDLNCCIKLVEAVPEVRDFFPVIAGLSPEWNNIITHWDELVAMLHDEVGPDWSNRKGIASNTYNRIKELTWVSKSEAQRGFAHAA